MPRTNQPQHTNPPAAAYLNVVLALCCTFNLTLLAVPLVGLMFLPSLFGAACWVGSALKDVGLID